MTTSKHRKGANSIERVAGNGLLDRRVLLSHGAALAGAMGVGAAGTATGAAKREGVALLLPAGGQVVHHASLAGTDDEGTRLL